MLRDYRDPIHGFISVDQCEQEIISTRYFQRLRNINQLGTSFLVYPSAMHTRFEHSLGTLFVTDKMLTSLLARYSGILGWQEENVKRYRRLSRLAALLHDVGHPPFSHAAEDILGQSKKGSKIKHEDVTYRIITETEISQIIDKHHGDGTSATVAQIAVGEARAEYAGFLSQLLTGDFGADRIDYLIRDSYHIGVEYGRFDVPRLLNTLQVRQNEETGGPELVLESGGIHTVEGFLLARYFMFLDVYFHKTRRILDIHLVEFLREHLSGKCYPYELQDYVQWDDHKVWALLISKRNTTSAHRLLDRKHYRLAFETGDHPGPAELERFDWLRQQVEERFGKDVRFDEAVKTPYSYKQPLIFVLHRGRYEPLKSKSAVVRRLSTIEKCRIYAEPTVRSAVEEFAEDFWTQRESRRRSS